MRDPQTRNEALFPYHTPADVVYSSDYDAAKWNERCTEFLRASGDAPPSTDVAAVSKAAVQAELSGLRASIVADILAALKPVEPVNP